MVSILGLGLLLGIIMMAFATKKSLKEMETLAKKDDESNE